MSSLDVEVRHPVGAVVTGFELRDLGPSGALGDDGIAELTRLLAEHGMVAMPGQDVDDHGFVAFLRRFGPLAFTTGETPVDGFPDLNVVSNIGRTTPPRSTFHVDTSYVRRPPAYTALRAVRVPTEGGATLFTNQYRAHDTLPPDVRRRLAGRTATHVVTGLDTAGLAETQAEHPLLRTHPVSGRTALYLSTPQRCVAVRGLDPDEGRRTVAYLFDHSTREDNVGRHAWAPGDVVMWDNRCVLHRADHDGVVGDRLLHRGTVAG